MYDIKWQGMIVAITKNGISGVSEIWHRLVLHQRKRKNELNKLQISLTSAINPKTVISFWRADLISILLVAKLLISSKIFLG